MSGHIAGPLTAQASEYYKTGNFTQCLEALKKLSSQLPSARGDPRLQHNMALVEYCARNCTDSVKIMKKLSEISQQGKKRSRRGGDKDKSEVLCTTEPGVPLLLYNQSVLLYQAKKYRSAMGLLETIFDNIEPVLESIAHRVCFLLLELYGLAIRTCSMSVQKCQNFKKSARAVLTYLQKPAGKADNNAKSSSKGDGHSNGYRLRLHVSKAKWFLMIHEINSAKTELNHALDLAKELPESEMHAVGVHNEMIPVLKANEQFLRSNYPTCLQILTLSFRGDIQEDVHLNNMGCVYFAMKRYSTAAYYFARAVKSNSLALHTRAQSGVVQRRDRSFNTGNVPANCLSEMMYNNGVSLLRAGHYARAFQYFQKATVFLPSWPQLWLHLADCCIRCHLQRQKSQPLIKSTVGFNSHHLIIMSTRSTEAVANRGNDENPMMSLGYAELCLRNVLLLADKARTEEAAVLRQFALIKLTYVSLVLKNAIKALNTGFQLLELKDCRMEFRQLAQVYCLEACALLDRHTQAQRICSVSEVPKDVEIGAAYCINVANIHILQNRLANAEKFARQALSLKPEDNKALRLLSYIFLRRGDTAAALATIRKRSAPPTGT